MKKVLLLAAIALGLNLAGQIKNDPLIGLPANETLKDLKITKSISKGGSVSDYFSYYDLAIQWADQSNVSNFIAPIFPDTTTTLYWYDGSLTSIASYGAMGTGALFDFSLEYWDNPFDDNDQVTVDSVFIAGYYNVTNSIQYDTLRFHVFKTDTTSASNLSRLTFPASTYSLYPGALNIWTMDYEGSSSQGFAGGITETNTTIVDYIFQVGDSASTIHGAAIPGGLTLSGSETFGIYTEFLPGNYGTNDTVNLSNLTGTTNNFMAYFASDQSDPLTGEFLTYAGSTHMNSSLWAYAETRYGLFDVSTQNFLNEMLLPSSRRMNYYVVHASGTSTVGIEDEALTSVSVFPNPSSDIVNVELGANTEATVTIVDILGQVVYSAKETFLAGERKVIDLSNNAKGMYILSVEGEGVNTVERITIK